MERGRKKLRKNKLGSFKGHLLQYFPKDIVKYIDDKLTDLDRFVARIAWIPSFERLLPMQLAFFKDCAEQGHVNLLQWASERVPIEKKKWGEDIFVGAASKGQLNVLNWALAKGCAGYNTIFSAAASHGRLDVLEWAKRVRPNWSAHTCASAAEGGRLEILVWLRENGCQWSLTTCSRAAQHGHLNILKWAIQNGCPHSKRICMYRAAENGRLEIIKYYHNEALIPINHPGLCAAAAAGGQMSTLVWLRENGYQWDAKTTQNAATIGHFEMLKWVRQNGCPWDARTFDAAFNSGRLDIVQWLRENNCPE